MSTKKTIRRFPRLPVYFELGQVVHHAEFGTGTITSILGTKLTIAFCDAVREMRLNQVVTRAQAEDGWRDCFMHGATRRLEEGRWLWIVRSLCSRRGEWTAFLEKWGVPRSSAHDLIKRFLQERFWESQHASGNRTERAAELGQQTGDRAAELNAGREKLVREERAKREKQDGLQSEDLTYWSVRIKLPEAVAENCREKYEEAGDDAKRYWVRAAYQFVDRENEIESSSDEEQEDSVSGE
jgi:hypothetical protein